MSESVREQFAQQIATILAPALDVRAPYAVQMVAQIADRFVALARERDQMRRALEQIAERDHVRDGERPPLVVALARWHECTVIAKQALRVGFIASCACGQVFAGTTHDEAAIAEAAFRTHAVICPASTPSA